MSLTKILKQVGYYTLGVGGGGAIGGIGGFTFVDRLIPFEGSIPLGQLIYNTRGAEVGALVGVVVGALVVRALYKRKNRRLEETKNLEEITQTNYPRKNNVPNTY